MDSLCRLCAKEKSPKQLVYNVDDRTLNIEQKLIDCCRWNSFIPNEELSKKICRTCFKKLESSWSFAESVTQAQNQLLALISDIKSELPIVEYLNIVDENDETNEVANDIKVLLSPCNSILDFDVDSISDDRKKTKREQSTARKTRSQTEFSTADYSNNDEQFEFSEKNKLFSILMESEENQPDIFDESIANNQHETTENIEICDVKCVKTQSDLNQHNFPEMIQDDERNDDGTVKMEAVQRLGLDNWTLIYYRCYLCRTRFPDRYECRNHFKVDHPDHQRRHLCTICNEKHFKQYKAMTEHVIAHHRRYFKYWYANIIVKVHLSWVRLRVEILQKTLLYPTQTQSNMLYF